MSHLKQRERQQHLLARSAALRESLGIHSRVIQQPLAVADRVADVLRGLYARPYLPVAAATLLIVFKPVRVLTWGGRIWWLWKSYKKAQKLLHR